MYHGILVDAAFDSPAFVKTMSIFAQWLSEDNDWALIGIEVTDEDLAQKVQEIQLHLKNDEPYYAHLYNDLEMVVIFKHQVFQVSPHISTWQPIIDYGKELNIPEDQLDFWPNRFQDEIHYFTATDFVQPDA